MTLQSLDNSLEEIKPSCSRTNTESDSDDGDSSLPELKLAKILDVVQSKKVPVQAQYNTINQSSDVKFGDEWHLHFHGVKITGEASDKPSSRSSEEIPVSNRRIPSCRRLLSKTYLPLLSLLIAAIIGFVAFPAVFNFETPKEPDSKPQKNVSFKQWPKFINRSMWNASVSNGGLVSSDQFSNVLVTHTGGNTCASFEECSKEVKRIQNDHMNIEKLPDISYNFLIGGDERVYEGRGWNFHGGVLNYNKTIDIAVIGDLNKEIPSLKKMSELCHMFLLSDCEHKLKSHPCLLNSVDFTEGNTTRISELLNGVNYCGFHFDRDNSEMCWIYYTECGQSTGESWTC